MCVAICQFYFYHAAIPFNAAQSPYFSKIIIETVGQYWGHGLKIPSHKEIAGRFLLKEIGTVSDCLKEHKGSRKISGCTIMSYGCKDSKSRNFD